MRKFKLSILAALLVAVAAVPVYAEMEADGFSRSENQHTSLSHAKYELFYNNSGSALISGTVVVLDTSGSGLNGATVSGDCAGNSCYDVDGSDGDVDNLGTYITTTSSADVDTVAGVVADDSCAAGDYCLVQTSGPRRVRCADSTDAVSINAAVGTTTVDGNCGGGSGLGRALEAGTGNDNGLIWVDIKIGMGSN